MHTLMSDKIYISQTYSEKGSHTIGEDIYSSDEESVKLITSVPGMGAMTTVSRGSRRRVHGVNLNVIEFDFDRITSNYINAMPGRPIECKCGSVFTNLCSYNEDFWTCLHCKSENEFGSSSEKKGSEERKEGKMEDIQCYKEEIKEEEKAEPDFRYVFLLDASGSMGTSEIKELNGEAPFDVLKKFIYGELDKLKVQHPQAKVGIIVFNNSIQVLGDGGSSTVIIKDKEAFDDRQKISTLTSEKASGCMKTPISKSCAALKEQLNLIECNYTTALGPALVAGLELLKGGNVGSKLMLCTDGNSNIGVGNLDPEAPLDKEFYKNFARSARSMGVEISVYTCSSEEIQLEVYFQLVKETYGSFLVVSPDQIAKEFSSPDEKKEIARNAQLTVFLPSMMKFHNVIDRFDIEKEENVFSKKYGLISEHRKELLKIILNKTKAPRYIIDGLRMVTVQCILDFIKNKIKYKVVISKRFVVVRTKGALNPAIAEKYADDITQTRLLQGKQSNAVEEIKCLAIFAEKNTDLEKEQSLRHLIDMNNLLKPVDFAHKGHTELRINKSNAMRGATTHFRPGRK